MKSVETKTRAMVALALVCLTGACSTTGLSMLRDDRVTITAPADRSTIALPVEVVWTDEGFPVGPGQGQFGVVVDRTPPRPGRTLASIFDSGNACDSEEACGDPTFLASHHVYATDATSLTIDRLPPAHSSSRESRHEITVFLLDQEGRRVGEGAWSVEVTLDSDA